jgi:hypothetical protein
MFNIERKDDKIKVTLSTSIGWSFTFTESFGSEPYAILLTQNFKNKFHDTISKIRRDAYNQGWEDKQKRRKKEDWFSGNI